MYEALILFSCSGLLVYWINRTGMLLHGSVEEIEEILEADLWWGRQLLLALRTMFFPSMRMMG